MFPFNVHTLSSYSKSGIIQVSQDSTTAPFPQRASYIIRKADQKADNHHVVQFAVQKVCIIFF